MSRAAALAVLMIGCGATEPAPPYAGKWVVTIGDAAAPALSGTLTLGPDNTEGATRAEGTYDMGAAGAGTVLGAGGRNALGDYMLTVILAKPGSGILADAVIWVQGGKMTGWARTPTSADLPVSGKPAQ